MIYDVIPRDGPMLGKLVEGESWDFMKLLPDGRLHREDSFDDPGTAVTLLNQEYGPVELLENTSHYMMNGEPVMVFEAMGAELAMRFGDVCVHVMARLSEAGTPYLEFSRSAPEGPPPEGGVTAEDVGVLSLLSSIYRR